MANILGKHILDNIEILEVDNNPSLNTGTNSSIGSFAFFNGYVFTKYGINDTDWKPVIVTSSTSDLIFNLTNIDGINNQILSTNGNGILSWIDNNTELEGNKISTIFEDFATGSVNGRYNWQVTNNGGSFALETGQVSIGNYVAGNRRLLCNGTTGTNFVNVFSSSNPIILGYYNIILESRVRVFSGTITDSTRFYFGLLNNTTFGDASSGIYFEYDILQSNTWRICTANSSTRTKINTTRNVNNEFVNLRIIINSSSATYFINGVNVGQINTNIPTSVSNITLKLEKNVGTSSGSAFLDYISFKAEFINTR